MNKTVAIATTLVLACQKAEVPPAAPDTDAGVCSIPSSIEQPVIAGMPHGERAELEALASAGVVAAKIERGQVRLLHACELPGKYRYQRTTWSQMRCDLKDAKHAAATLSFGLVDATAYAGQETAFSLLLGTRGVWVIDGVEPTKSLVTGPCGEATHYVRSISVGAMAIVSGDKRELGGKLDVTQLISGGGGVSKALKVSNTAGDVAACLRPATSGAQEGKSERRDGLPRLTEECAAPIGLSLRELGEGSCDYMLRNAIELDGTSRLLGRCEREGDVEIQISGTVQVPCVHAQPRHCEDPAQLNLAIEFGEQQKTFLFNLPARPGNQSDYSYTFESRVVGTVHLPAGTTAVSLKGVDCHYESSQHNKFCRFREGFNVSLRETAERGAPAPSASAR